MITQLYEAHKTDYYGWLMHNIALLRQKRFPEVDMDHITEELIDMGGSIRGKLGSDTRNRNREKKFPATCPFTFEQCLDEGFFPEDEPLE